MTLDGIDRQIIEALAEDARTPLAQIAQRIGVATATVHQRTNRLRERGVIRGSRLVLDWEQIGLPVAALISLALPAAGSLEEVAAELEAVPYVQSCFAVTGEFDLLMVVRARSSAHLGEVLEDIRRHAPGMSRTVVVLSTYFEGRMPPLPDPATG